jgi:hypothetical protein
VAAEIVSVRASVRESKSGSTVVSGAEMAVSAAEMPSPEMAAAEVVATTMTSTVPAAMTSAVAAATSAKRCTRQYGREHNDGNPNA